MTTETDTKPPITISGWDKTLEPRSIVATIKGREDYGDDSMLPAKADHWSFPTTLFVLEGCDFRQDLGQFAVYHDSARDVDHDACRIGLVTVANMVYQGITSWTGTVEFTGYLHSAHWYDEPPVPQGQCDYPACIEQPHGWLEDYTPPRQKIERQPVWVEVRFATKGEI